MIAESGLRLHWLWSVPGLFFCQFFFIWVVYCCFFLLKMQPLKPGSL